MRGQRVKVNHRNIYCVTALLIGNFPFADPFVKKQENLPEILQVSRERKPGRRDRPL